MVESLANIYFYLILTVIYLVLILSIANSLNVFRYSGKTRSINIDQSRSGGSRLLKKNIDMITSAVIRLKNISLKVNDLIFRSLFRSIFRTLALISKMLDKTELKSFRVVAASSAEVFTYMSLITRKTVETEIQVVWSVFFVFMVLIYFILTMQ